MNQELNQQTPDLKEVPMAPTPEVDLAVTPWKEEPTTENDHRSNPHKPVLFGVLLILIAFGGFIVWAATAPLDSAVLASGVVVVEGQRKVVQHLEGGIVNKIYVKDGDTVNKGDVIILLDDTRAKAVLEIIKGQLYAAYALEARLISERDGTDEITFPDVLLLDNSENTIKIMEGQKQLFEARRHSLGGQIDILRQKIAQYQEEITGLQAQQVSREDQIALFEKELVGLEKLQSQKNIAENFVLEKKRELAELKGEQGKYQADVARARQGIGEAELSINQLSKNLREEVVLQLRDVQTTIADLEERLVTARDVLDRTRITAPASGVVIGLSIHTEGGVVASGKSILEIVPQNEALIFEARVQLTDIDDIELGQLATVRLSAFSFRNNLLIQGEVINVSADRLTDPMTGDPYYGVEIKVHNEELAKLGNNRLMPGMPVEAQIKTGKRTMLDYIITPFKDSFARAFKEK